MAREGETKRPIKTKGSRLKGQFTTLFKLTSTSIFKAVDTELHTPHTLPRRQVGSQADEVQEAVQ